MIAGILEIQMMANMARLSDDMRRAERVVGDSMGKVEKSVASAKQAMASLGMGLSIGLIADQMRRTADTFVKLDAQIRNSTKSQRQYNQALADIRRISTIAQADISATTALYTRLLNATDGMGISQGKLAIVTETISFGLKAFGASSAEAASAQLQLSQAIGSGRLGGEEFRAAMESMPNVMKVLAKSMGVPLGELRALSIAGKITTAEMVKAFGDPAVAAEFKRMAEKAQTITGAWTVARNELTLLFGEFAKSSGITGAFIASLNAMAGLIRITAQYVDDLAVAFGIWATIVGGKLVASLVAARMNQILLNAAHAEALAMNVAMARTADALAAANLRLAGSTSQVAAAEALMAASSKGMMARMTSLVGKAGIVGIILWGVYEVADYLGIVDKIFKGVEERAAEAAAKRGGASLQAMDVEIASLQKMYDAQVALEKSRTGMSGAFAQATVGAFEISSIAIKKMLQEAKAEADAMRKAMLASATGAPSWMPSAKWQETLMTPEQEKQKKIADLNALYFAEVELAGRSQEAQLQLAKEYIVKLAMIKDKAGKAEHVSAMKRLSEDLRASNEAEVSGRLSNVEKVAAAWAKLTEAQQADAQTLADTEAALTQARIADWHKVRDQIADSITRGIMEGAKAEDVLKNMFRDMVLEPQVKLAVTAGVDWVAEMLGLTTATAVQTNSNMALISALNANTAALGGKSASGDTSGASGVGGAAAVFWAVFAVVAVKAYRSLTKEQEIRTTGIAGTVTFGGVRGGEYSAIERVASGFQQLFGDDGSYTRTMKDFTAQQQLQLDATFNTVKSNVTQFADQLGLSTSALETFAMTFDIVGGSFATLAGQITDQMAYALLGLDYGATRQSIFLSEAYIRALMDMGNITAENSMALLDTMTTSALNAQLPAWFKDLQRAGESVGDTLVRVTTELKTVDKVWSMLGFDAIASFGEINTALGEVSSGAIVAREALIEAMGGLDSFTATMSSFYDKFYTQAEKVNAAQNNLNAGFSELGIGIPASYTAFKELLSGLDLTTEEGRNTYATLIGLADSFATVQAAADALAKTNLGWQQKINVLLGIQTQQQVDLENALVGVDDSTAALIRRYYALQEAQAATTKTYTDAVVALDKVKKFAADVRSFMDSLWDGALAPMAQSYSVLFQRFAQINALAAGGDVSAQGKLQGSATAFLESAKLQAGSALEYARSFGMVQAGLEATATATENAVTQAEQTLQAALTANEFLQRISVSSAETVNSLIELRTLLAMLGGAPESAPRLVMSPELGPPTGWFGGPGGVHAFANGAAFTNGIYSSPTPFMFANGAGFSAGVMGEAGDEAVMPLQRGPDGRLGVSAHGGSGDVAEEVRLLRAEVGMLRRDNQAGQVAIATSTQRMYRVLDRWNGEGIPPERIAG